jgi:hypothetical protein
MAEVSKTSPISLEHVKQALNAVTETVFPYWALETQQLQMTRMMFKPVELNTRQMAASINRLNNALPFFKCNRSLQVLTYWAFGMVSSSYMEGKI